ncbi:MAG: DNA polymerase Y family protein, partial [Gammaproteobacteria bacterium]|nr:DNA polymerase Y family protein [Gammaproteobacteria bacterium]
MQQQQLDFVLPKPDAIAPCPVLQQTRHRPLWLCLYFPELALEVYKKSCKARDAVAVVEADGNRQIIVACNAKALAAGVHVHMPLSAAWALAPALEICLRNNYREQQALFRLANWAGRFTPQISIEAPNALLLEIRGSLKLFGGVQKLREEILSGISIFGHASMHAVAPTPLAALWLARGNTAACIDETKNIRRALTALDIRHTAWEAEKLQGLRGIGVSTLHDCLRLPRAGFARRFGKDQLLALDRALGEVGDARKFYAPPACFKSELTLNYEVENNQVIIRAARQLVEELTGYLRIRNGAVQSFTLRLHHRDMPPDTI